MLGRLSGQDGEEAGNRGGPDGEPGDVLADDAVVEKLEPLHGRACGQLEGAADHARDPPPVEADPGEGHGEGSRGRAVRVASAARVLVDAWKWPRRRSVERLAGHGGTVDEAVGVLHGVVRDPWSEGKPEARDEQRDRWAPEQDPAAWGSALA